MLSRASRWLWKNRLQLHRGLASSSRNVGGPDVNKVRAVKFTQSQEVALEAFDAHHRSFYTWVPSPIASKKFLPFWAVAAKVLVRMQSARLGTRTTSWSYDAQQRKQVPHVTMVYRTVRWADHDPKAPTWVLKFEPTSTDMQIYASYDYHKAHVNSIRTKDTFRGIQRLKEAVQGNDEEIQVFKMRPSAALEIARVSMKKKALEYAQRFLTREFKADLATNISVQYDVQGLNVSPVYVPVYVLENRYLGEAMHTFVHGTTLATGGQRLYNSIIALGAFGGSLLFGGLTGTHIPGAFVVPMVITILYPLFGTKLRKFFGARKESEAQQSSGLWDEPYVAPMDSVSWEEDDDKSFFDDFFSSMYYGVNFQKFQERFQKFQEQYQRFEQQQQRQYQQQSYQGSGSQGQRSYGRSQDPRGYYAKLGLEPGASEDEIKSAFKKLALKQHPDRFTDPKEVERAKVKFQDILAAYQVLRDSKKRRVYNETGTG